MGNIGSHVDITSTWFVISSIVSKSFRLTHQIFESTLF